MSNHTKALWSFKGNDARRVVACLNACEGISTENLEDNKPIIELANDYNAVLKQRDVFAELAAFQRDARLGALKELAKVEGQRDELLKQRNELRTALEEVIEYLEPRVEGGKVGAALLPRLKAVMASVKGGVVE